MAFINVYVNLVSSYLSLAGTCLLNKHLKLLVMVLFMQIGQSCGLYLMPCKPTKDIDNKCCLLSSH